MRVEKRIADPSFLAGVVTAKGVRIGPSAPELRRLLEELARRRATEDFPPSPLKESIRGLLRRGGFKPSGRNKPASEYLAQAAREGRFPLINNLVDINNLLSLETGLPISLLDRRAFGDEARLRYGQAGEKYVFNSAGQEIDLNGLICVCGAGDAPLGNPVKDSMAGKLKSDTDRVVGVLYADRECEPGRALAEHAERFGLLLKDFGGAAEIRTFVV